jgi:hypothetical protein
MLASSPSQGEHLQRLVRALPEIQARHPDYFEKSKQRPLRVERGR